MKILTKKTVTFKNHNSIEKIISKLFNQKLAYRKKAQI